MSETEVSINDDNMTKWKPDCNYYEYDKYRTKFLYVVYCDSIQCSPCFISGLTEWEEFICLESSKKYDISFLFIIEPRKNEINTIRYKLREIEFKHSVLIDDKSIFRKENPHIPEESMYHTFLLNDKNKIILVGNPIHNNSIKRIFYKTLNNNI